MRGTLQHGCGASNVQRKVSVIDLTVLTARADGLRNSNRLHPDCPNRTTLVALACLVQHVLN
jgi:hypothetical protein